MNKGPMQWISIMKKYDGENVLTPSLYGATQAKMTAPSVLIKVCQMAARGFSAEYLALYFIFIAIHMN